MRYFILFFTLFFLASCGPGESGSVKAEDSKPQTKVEDDEVPKPEPKPKTRAKAENNKAPAARPTVKVEDDKVPTPEPKAKAQDDQDDQDDDSAWSIRGVWGSFTGLFSESTNTEEDDLNEKKQRCASLQRHCFYTNKHDMNVSEQCQTEYISCLKADN